MVNVTELAQEAASDFLDKHRKNVSKNTFSNTFALV
jgi:hypothetical protein